MYTYKYILFHFYDIILTNTEERDLSNCTENDDKFAFNLFVT